MKTLRIHCAVLKEPNRPSPVADWPLWGLGATGGAVWLVIFIVFRWSLRLGNTRSHSEPGS